jgi:hypothetical protein
MSPEAPRSPHSKKVLIFLPYGPRPREREDVSILLAIPLAQRVREEAKEARGWSKASTANVINSYTADREKNCAQSRKRPQGERSGWRGPWLEEGLGHLLSPLPGSSSYHHTGRKGHKNSGWIQGIITIYSPAILNQHLNYQENDSY